MDPTSICDGSKKIPYLDNDIIKLPVHEVYFFTKSLFYNSTADLCRAIIAMCGHPPRLERIVEAQEVFVDFICQVSKPSPRPRHSTSQDLSTGIAALI